jgi:WD40 repeat protein
VSCADDGTLRVHTLGVHGDLRPRYLLTSPTQKPMHAFCYSQKHAAVATCGLERHVHWWSLSIAEPISTFYGHAAAVVDVAIDDEHHQLISVDTDACVRIWCVRRFVSVQVIDSPHGAPVTALLYDATLRTLLIAHTAPSAFVSIDAKPAGTAAPRPPSPRPPSPRPPSPGGGGGGGDKQRMLLSAVSSASLAIALAVDDISTVRSFHCADGDVCHRFQLMDTTAAASGVGGDAASCIAFDHSGRRLLVGQRNGRVKILNFSSGAVLGECEPPRADATGACELTAIQGMLVANLAYIVAVGWSREVWVWADQRDNQSFVVSCSRVLRGHRADVTCLDFAAPNMLATGSNDAYVMLWNFGSGQIRSLLLHQPLTPQPRVNPSSASAHKFVTTTTCVAVERLALIKLDGETATPLLVTAGSDGRLRLWSASAAQLLHVLPLTPAPGLYSSAAALITTLHWNARAGVLVAGDSEGRVGLWDGSALRPALSGQLIPMTTVARVTGDASAEGMSDGDANALSAKERIYRCLRPLARWHAHGEAVLSTSILAAAWEGLVPRLAPEAAGTGGADGAGGGGAAPTTAPPPKPMLEMALAQHGASGPGPAARRPARRGERPVGERAEPFGTVLDFTPLLMTGAGDECRLWTLDGQHVGRLGAERWRVTEQDTYAPPPPTALLEPASSWAHPPSDGSASNERTPRRGRSGAGSSAFLTALADDEPVAPIPAAPCTMSVEEQARIRPMIDVIAKHFRRAGMRTAARAQAPTHGGHGEGERYDNPASERDALLTHGAQQGVFALLSTSQSAAGSGPLAFGRRPSSAALRQAASAPVLPPLGERRAAGAGGLAGGALDDATILRRAEERSRALLRARFREYQEETGRGPGLTTFATDQFFRQREEAKINKPPPREPMKVHPLGKITRRERAEKGERMERMRFM